MRATEFINKQQGVAEGRSKDFAERHYAAREIEKILDNLLSSESPNVTPEIFKKIKELVAITGRSQDIRYFGSAGELLDQLVDMYRQSQIRSGQMPQFTGRASAARDMARQIANQTRGTYRYIKPQTWTTRFGQRYRDPADYVVYPDQQSYDDALEWIENKGKKVRYRDNFGGLTDATQIGSYIIEPSTFTQDAFSDKPQTTHRISVRLAKTINQGGREQIDITDQQAAALQDIASTKSQNAIQSIQLILKVLQGEQNIKQIINNSKKITPQDKAKLDAIIAGAKNFQEPNQGVAEDTDHGNNQPLRLRANTGRVQKFIEAVYARYPQTFQNNHVMSWGEGEAQQLALFELVPSMSKRDAVDVKWFQAYPLRQGVGSRAMRVLQDMAREDGISLTLYPWDKGQISQAKLIKFYKSHGFKPTIKGSKNMVWEPVNKQGVAEAAQNDLSTIIQSFVASPAGQKYKQHDCKTVTRAFVAWAEQNKITTQVVSLAPPSAEFIAKNPRYKGKSGQGDGHIMPIVNGNAIDFTVRQFGVGRPFENPLITPTNSLPAVYGKFGYFTDKPEWFLGGKSHWIGSLNSIPSEIFNQNFGDELLEQSVAEGSDAEAYKEKLLTTLPQIMRFFEKNGKGWKPSKEQMLAAVETGYTVMKHTGDVKQAGKAMMDELNTLHRMGQDNQDVAEGSEEINWIKPNFDYEWEEIEFQAKQPQVPPDVRNYMAKHFPNKQAWMKSVQHGRPVVVSPNHGQKIRNYTDNKKDLLNALSPQSHDPQGPAKANRVNALFDKGGPIEMPIILKTNKGLWLIGGKTRLGTANLLKGIPAKVWMIGGEQSVAEDKISVKPSPGKGNGLFATKPIKAGEVITRSKFVPIDNQDWNLIKNTTPVKLYGFKLGDQHALLPGPFKFQFKDPKEKALWNKTKFKDLSLSGFMFINGADLPDEVNSEEKFSGKTAEMIATRDIQPGEEIIKQYNVPTTGVAEAWSEKYKKSINCKNPKGFSQRAHCQGRKKK